MITFKIESQEVFDGTKMRLIPEDIYKFENTLSAQKKWEAVYQKPWRTEEPHTKNEIMYYFKCMNVEDREIYPELLTGDQFASLVKYLDNPMGAHKLPKSDKRGPKTVFTAEVIYAYCIVNRIPLDWAEKQNVNQLLTILGVVNILNSPPEKKSMSAEERRTLNMQRRAQLKTKG